jgi:hypothetical protein
MQKKIKIVLFLIFTYIITELISYYICFILTDLFGDGLTDPFQIAWLLTNLFLAYNISLNQNWARICLIILYLIDILYYFHQIENEFAFDLSIGIISVIKKLLQLSIMIILFSRTSNKWFNVKPDDSEMTK